ncbi:MAG: class I SAM-dependent methyltransferase [Halorhabdus sp.]
MAQHTFDASGASGLEDESRHEYLSVDELLKLLDPDPADVVADLGSGTGFYTRPVAEYVDRIVAIDLQPAMHAAFDEYGVPVNVDRVTATIESLPVRTNALDAVFSTMTYHEFADERALSELHRALIPGGRLAIADWTAAGERHRGPPLDERFDARMVAAHLERAGFAVERAQDRRETLVVAATRPGPSRQS